MSTPEPSEPAYHLDERLRKEERLRKRHEFRHAQRRGSRTSGKHFVVYACVNNLDWSRLGLTASRKVGNAYVRNRWKRRVREIFRGNKTEFPRGYDYVVIIRRAPEKEPDFDTLRDELLDSMRRAANRADEETRARQKS